MYTSGTDGAGYRTAFAYLLLGLGCALFGAVYERFSHEVYSFYMLYAFLFPLAGGAAPFLGLALFGAGRAVPGAARGLYHCGIATLTTGSILRGILEIYGTTNALTKLYWIVGSLLCAAGILVFGISSRKNSP